jgi:hypothetical protein
MHLSSIASIRGGQYIISSSASMLRQYSVSTSCKSYRFDAEFSEADNLSYYPPTFTEKWANKKSRRQVILDFDYIGLILFSGGLLIFLMGVSWGGSYYPWKSAHVIATIIVGFFTLVAFALYEIFAPLKEPLVPMHLFKNLPWVSDICMVACGASVYYCFSIIWPIMVFSLYTSDLTKGGLLCCVTGIGTNTGQILSGALSRKIGHQKYQVMVSASSMGIFLACTSPSVSSTSSNVKKE